MNNQFTLLDQNVTRNGEKIVICKHTTVSLDVEGGGVGWWCVIVEEKFITGRRKMSTIKLKDKY